MLISAIENPIMFKKLRKEYTLALAISLSL